VRSDLLLVIVVVAAALAFDFTNGFHDTANVVASAISTRALAPRTAIALDPRAHRPGDRLCDRRPGHRAHL
jgi:hypothetical protein